ncbi:MAG: hypothetical protein HQL50_07215 [Magnetococcales bacterium]|nr:hypothetical protein [Magnetococcales bacterium]
MRFSRALILGLLLLQLVGTPPVHAEERLPQLQHNPFKRPSPPPEPESVVDPETLEQLALAEDPEVWQPQIRAVATFGNQAMVNVNGTLIRIGESIEGYTLIRATEQQVVFEKGGVQVQIDPYASYPAATEPESEKQSRTTTPEHTPLDSALKALLPATTPAPPTPR